MMTHELLFVFLPSFSCHDGMNVQKATGSRDQEPKTEMLKQIQTCSLLLGKLEDLPTLYMRVSAGTCLVLLFNTCQRVVITSRTCVV